MFNTTLNNSNPALSLDSQNTAPNEYWSILTFSIWKIFFSIASFVVCFLTASGNVLVLYSFKVNKKLRTTNNYFLISLAIADSVIGFVSLPLATIYFLTEKWLLGPYICDLWLCIDYTVSNASAANLLLISFDRYFSITRPLTYRANRTTKKVTILIAISWLISMLLWTPFIIIYNSWPYIRGERGQSETECKVQFLNTNKYLTLGTACAAFYIPVTVICIVYFKIWRTTKKRHVELRKLMQAESYTKAKDEKYSNIKKMRDDIRNYDKIKSKRSIKTFLNNLVDKEEEEENDLNENSTMSNESNNNNNTGAKHVDTSYEEAVRNRAEAENLDDISDESCKLTQSREKQFLKTKYSLDSFDDRSKFTNRKILPEKWYNRVLNTHSNCCISFLFSRIFKRHAQCTASSEKPNAEYSKCKIYYKSSAANNKEAQQPKSSSNCRHCQNEFSFYTIVIQLNNYNNGNNNTNTNNCKASTNKNNNTNETPSHNKRNSLDQDKNIAHTSDQKCNSTRTPNEIKVQEYSDHLTANEEFQANQDEVLLKNSQKSPNNSCDCDCKIKVVHMQNNNVSESDYFKKLCLPKIESSIELDNLNKEESKFLTKKKLEFHLEISFLSIYGM